MRQVIAALTAVLCVLGGATAAEAQGGGASSTGSIGGKVADASGGVLPGVSVTATSPSLMGVQTAVTDAGGAYRFPALPPGIYAVTYELTGFNTVKRENIQISIGFTATVNVELTVATLQESVTVTGESPVIDTTATRIQQNFKLDSLQSIPNARDLWALLAVTPSITTQRVDVGGSQAGSQFGYTAYGFTGQNQLLVEGINTTYHTATSMLYMDYGSFEEVFIGTVGNGAEVAVPGVQSQMLGKSGGNRFQGEVYQDYENNSFQGGNIPSDVIARGVREGSNELENYRDMSVNVGGPIRRDRVWWYGSYHNQEVIVQQPNFVGPIAGETFDTSLWNLSGKITTQATRNHKFIGYYQWSNKEQPNALPDRTLFYSDLNQTWSQPIRSWVYKGEWNGTLSNNLFAEARYGQSSVSASHIANNDTTEFLTVDSAQATYVGGSPKDQFIFRRPQLTGSVSYFKDGWRGTHNFKAGAGVDWTVKWDGYLQVVSGNVRQNVNNGRPISVVLYAPTATHVGAIDDGPNGNLLQDSRMTVSDAFVSDQWNIGRATLNLGLRWDRYHAWSPEQRQLAYSFGPLSVPDATFPERDYVTWDLVVPRVGFTYDLTGDGRTIAKASWGLYGFDPGINFTASVNPNQSQKSLSYTWSDNLPCAGCIAGDGKYQPGEEGAQTSSALANAVTLDSGVDQPTSTQATAFIERQLTDGVGLRAGFVYLGVRNQTATFQPLRPASAYTTPFTAVDPGVDGLNGTGDDGALTFYGIPNSQIGDYPNTSVVMNTPQDGTYKTVEAAITKRPNGRYSAAASVGYTWQHDFPNAYPNTPNGPFEYDYSIYSAKATASYTLPWDIMLTGLYRLQAGTNYARTLSVAAPASCACTFSAARGGALTNTTVFVGDYADYRNDNVSVVDLRVEKTLRFGQAARLRLFLDGFNLFNSYAAEIISVATGSAFQRPTAIIAPRTARVGLRFMW